MDRHDAIVINSSSGSEDSCFKCLDAGTSDNVIVISSDDKEDNKDNDDDVYFVPRRQRMISDGDDLPRIRRERRNRNRRPRPWSKIKQKEPIEINTNEGKEKEASFDDEPPRIPPLPDLSDVLPDLTQDPSPQKHGRKPQTSKENAGKEENKNPRRCQPVTKRKSKSVDFYKTQSNAILGELFSVSDGDKFMIPSWHKQDGQTSAFIGKHKTESRQRNGSGCSARSRNSSGNSVASNEHFETPSKRRTSSSRLEDNAFLSTKVVHETDRSGDEQQRKRFKKETKIHSHHKHLSNTKSLKSSNHKKSIHLHHSKKVQNIRSSSVDIPLKKPSHPHLPKRSISVGEQPVKVKAGVFEVLESMSQSQSETDSDIGSTTESIKLKNEVWSHSFHEKQKIWNNCSVRLNKLLIKFKGDGIVATEKVSKAERHFLDVTNKDENVLKPCDTDSLTVDLLSVSESNDEEVEQNDSSLKQIASEKYTKIHSTVRNIIDETDVILIAPEEITLEKSEVRIVSDEKSAKNSVHACQRDSVDSQKEHTCTDVTKDEKNDKRLNYSLKSNEFSDVSDDERCKKLDYSLKDELLSDISDAESAKLDYSVIDISDAENTRLDYSFKSGCFSDVSDTEETVSHCDTVSRVTAKDSSEGNKESPSVPSEVKHECDSSINSDVDTRNSKDLLQDNADSDVDNTADTDLGNAGKLSPTRNRSTPVTDCSMPILERMSLEFSETALTVVEDIPVLDKEDSDSSSDDNEDVRIVGTMSAPASVCDFNIFSKIFYPKSTRTSSSSLKSLSSYPQKSSPLHSSYSVDGLENADSIDSLPSITPSKSRKRKVSCTPTKHATSQHSVYRRFLPSYSESKPRTRLGVQEQTTQLSALLKDYLLVLEHNPGISDMPDANKNMVAGCEEDDQMYMSHAFKLLNHFSKKHYIPNDLISQVIGSTFYGENSKENHVHSLSHLVKTLDNTYPGHFRVRWEEMAKCLDVLTSVDRRSEEENTQASSHLRLLVQFLKNDLYCKDLGDSREIHRTCAHRMLSYEAGSSGRRREVVSYLKRELHVGNTTSIAMGTTPDTDRARNVIKELQELLQLAVDCSSSCVDCANTLAGDLMSTYVYLPHVDDKHALLAGTCSPLLRYKLLELILENQYSGTLPLGGFPESLRAVIQCFFRATPLINPLTPPISPVEEIGAVAGEEGEERLTVYTPQDTEELAMLLYHVVDSYLISSQEKLYMALRRRSQYSDRNLRDEDRIELARLPEHVTYLERHLRRLSPELTPSTDHYLMLLTCLADLS